MTFVLVVLVEILVVLSMAPDILMPWVPLGIKQCVILASLQWLLWGVDKKSAVSKGGLRFPGKGRQRGREELLKLCE